ncbi:PAS domain S-box protein [Candidatus Bipolaricaulota bacterium]|nr:PAS domain S-box protein [Candidatus Bipolaricaulota bacterium]
MNFISLLDFVFSLSILIALTFLFTGWKRALRKDVKLVLTGLLIILLSHGVIRFLEWSNFSLEGLDYFSDLLATLEPMLWVFFFYSFLQQVSARRKEHLNSVLRSIRKVNQLLVRTDDRGSLIHGTCKTLFEARGYDHVWVILLDKTNGLLTAAQEGVGLDFKDLLKRIKADKLPHCVKKSLTKSKLTITEDPSSTDKDCPLSNIYGSTGAITTRLEYEGRLYGLLSASVPSRFINEEREKELLEEVGEDIAYALHKLEIEKDLRKSEEEFRSYLENAPVGVYMLDEEGNYLEVNKTACEMTGYSKEELLDMGITDLHPSQASEDAREAFEKLLDEGEMRTELSYTRKDGTKRHFLVNSVRISEDRYLGFTLDITERKKAEKKLEQTTLETLQALNRTIEAKDEYTGGHIDRVQRLSVKAGRKLGLSEEKLEQLRYASILHDIGKIGVPDSILGKPGELNEREWEEMEKHPEVGERIVSQVDRLKRAAKIIGQHQERYDGTGYPKGLQGDEITLEAQIVAVADAWDAMRTDRPYREALPREEAMRELKENAGTQFDPEIVEVMLELIEEGEIEPV